MIFWSLEHTRLLPFFSLGSVEKNDRALVPKVRAFGAECSPGISESVSVPGAFPMAVLQLLSVFSTITLDPQGLWKFPFRLDLGTPLIAELISAFLKFLADCPISYSVWRMWNGKLQETRQTMFIFCSLWWLILHPLCTHSFYAGQLQS